MLTLTPHQVQTLSEGRLADFLPRAIEFLRDNLPAKLSSLPEEELRGSVMQLVERAQGFGLFAECDVVAYCDLSLRFDRPLEDAFPWAGGILNDTAMPAVRKMPVIVEGIAMRHVYQEAG